MSGFIRQAEHEGKRPVRVERDFPDVLVIEGVRWAGEIFRTFSEPDDKYLYSLRREGDQVILVTVHNEEEAKAFFAEAGY